jgi:hypothetical protein
MSALIIQGLISGAVGGLTAIIKNSASREEARQQAFHLREQINALDSYSASAISNLEEIFGKASGQVREAMTTQAQLAVDDITQQFTDSIDTMTKSLEKARGNFGDQAEARRETYIESLKNYSDSMKEQRQGIKNAFVAQRMGVSGAFVDAMTKSAKVQSTNVKGMNADQMKFESQIAEQLANVEQSYAEQISKTTDTMGRQVSKVRLNAGAQISQALSGLELQLGQQQQAYRDSAFNQRQRLSGAADNLDAAANNGNWGTDLLGGAAAGLTSAASGAAQNIFDSLFGKTGNTVNGAPAPQGQASIAGNSPSGNSYADIIAGLPSKTDYAVSPKASPIYDAFGNVQGYDNDPTAATRTPGMWKDDQDALNIQKEFNTNDMARVDAKIAKSKKTGIWY